jgi:hypothetical protein
VGVVVIVAAVGGTSSTGSGSNEPADSPKKVMSAKAGKRFVSALKSKPAEGMSAKTTKKCGTLSKRYPASPARAGRVLDASPVFTPEAPKDLEAEAEVVVVAQVQRVAVRLSPDARPKDLKGLPPAERAAALRIMREQVATLSVCEVHKGSVGSTVDVARLGDSTLQVETDGPYKVGERYMLYLIPRDLPAGKKRTYRVVSTEGRMFLRADGSIDNSGEHSAVGEMLDGLPGVNAVDTLVGSNVPAPPPPTPPTITSEDLKKGQAAAKSGKANAVMDEVLEVMGDESH